MATTPLQPGSIEFLHYFVQQGTAGGKVSALKGTLTGSVIESEIENVQRYPLTLDTLKTPQSLTYLYLLYREIELMHATA